MVMRRRTSDRVLPGERLFKKKKGRKKKTKKSSKKKSKTFGQLFGEKKLYSEK